MSARFSLLWMFLGLASAACIAGKATAEILAALLPEGVPGYDTDPGVTVMTRLHPDQMPLGLREGPFLASPRLDESIGYSSNALPGRYRRGSWQIVTAPMINLATDWSRDAAGALVSVQDTRVLGLPAQSRTDATVSAGARLDVGQDQLSIAAAHIASHEDRAAVGSIASDRPVGFRIDDVRASYAMTSGRWSLTPSIEASQWTYDPTTILGVPSGQSYRDRIVMQGGATLRYNWAPLRNFIVVLRVLGQDDTRTPPNQISRDSISYQMLAGLDDAADPVWHWRLLVGGEARRFTAPSYRAQNNLIAEAGLGWSPSGMTTVNATLSRATGDAAQEGVSGLTYTSARLTIDHEYLRDLLLRASLGWQQADFFQGGQQSGSSAGFGLTWVMNRSMRLSFTYDQTDLRGARLPGGTIAAGYSRGLGLVTLRLGL